jgi:DNA-binding PadR family transcriptional regulator
MPSRPSDSGVGRVLSALLVLHTTFGFEEAPKERVQSMAKISNSTFPSMLSRMVKKGLIAYGSTPKTLKITDKGREEAPDIEDMPTSNVEHHEEIKKKLKGKARRIFEYLADGKVHAKEKVMEAVDCTNPKTFAPLMSRELKKPGYIEYPSMGKVRLSNECFPFGRVTDE